MKRVDLKKYRKKTVSELKKELSKKKLELLSENVNLSVGKSSNPNKKRMLRRDISQISTIIHEKELFESIKEKSKKGEEKVKS